MFDSRPSFRLPHFSMDRRVKPGGDEKRNIAAKIWRTEMPKKKSRKDDQPTEKDFLKRRTYEQGRAMMDAAHLAVQRLYCDAFEFWRRCKKKPCRRHRRCCGNQSACLMHGLPFTPPAARVAAEKEVIAGGRHRVPPASHAEWVVRRSALRDLISWGFG